MKFSSITLSLALAIGSALAMPTMSQAAPSSYSAARFSGKVTSLFEVFRCEYTRHVYCR